MKKLSDDEIAHLYASLMAEVKSRLQKIHLELSLLKIPKPQVERVYHAEICYLQLRRIAELVSVGILVAHNPYDKFRNQDLAKIYNPSTLLGALSKLGAAAFPQPIGLTRKPPFGEEPLTFALPRPTFDARDAITETYTIACDRLHLGGLHTVLRQRNKQYSGAFIEQSFHRLAALLDKHVILLPDQRAMLAWIDWGSDENVFCQWLDPPEPRP